MGKLFFLLVFSVALAVFASQNTGLVYVRFLGWKTSDMPLALIVVLSAGAGGLIAYLAGLPTRHRRSRELREKMRELESLREQQLH
jgi:uncharacterized integral membrane protein